MTGFEKGPNLAENRVDFVSLQPEMEIPSLSQELVRKLPLNEFTDWNFHRNKAKTYQNRE